MAECTYSANSDCTLSRANKLARERGRTSYEARLSRVSSDACTGTQRLDKTAFLSMIGARKDYRATGFVVSNAEARLQEMKKALADSDNDIDAAASKLETTPSRFRARLNALSSVVESSIIRDQPASPTPQRRYFEGLSTPWSIVAFDSTTREVCVDLKAKSGTSHLSVTVPPQSMRR